MARDHLDNTGTKTSNFGENAQFFSKLTQIMLRKSVLMITLKEIFSKKRRNYIYIYIYPDLHMSSNTMITKMIKSVHTNNR